MGYKIVCLNCGREIVLKEENEPIQKEFGIRVSILSTCGSGNMDISCECGNIFNVYE